MAEHALLIHLPMPPDPDGDPLWDLEDALVERFDASDDGDYDGNDLGGSEMVLYMYGPDADRLLEVARPVLAGHGVPVGTYAIKRFGGVDEEGVRTERVDL